MNAPRAWYGDNNDPTSRFRPRLDWPTGLESGPTVAWVGLNPSTATEHELDPTLTRIQGFSAAWGFGRFAMLNLWPLRATDPALLWQALGGPRTNGESVKLHHAIEEQDQHIVEAAGEADLVMLAWGAGSKGRADDKRRLAIRAAQVLGLLRGSGKPLAYLAMTAEQQPGHPLYLKSDLVPLGWKTGEPVVLPGPPTPAQAALFGGQP